MSGSLEEEMYKVIEKLRVEDNVTVTFEDGSKKCGEISSIGEGYNADLLGTEPYKIPKIRNPLGEDYGIDIYRGPKIVSIRVNPSGSNCSIMGGKKKSHRRRKSQSHRRRKSHRMRKHRKTRR